MSENVVDYLLELLEKKGSDIQYGNEDVTQLEHALQCAELAEQNNKSDAFITAALLHDIGHLLYEDKDLHEDLGADYLSKYFGEEVTLPIRAHVASKRYLAAIEDGYYDQLSEASKESLKVQGGIFTKEEAEEFINKPQMKEAVEMRRYDDQAKILNKVTPSLEHFRQYVENSFQASAN